MSDSEHALLNASAAVGWSTCGAYLRLNAGERKSSKYADEGSAAHEVASWCLTNEAMPDAYPNPAVEIAGAQYPVNQEMKNAVADYLGVVRKAAEGGTLLVEQKVDYSFWILGPKPPEIKGQSWLAGGTSDAVILHEEKITIVDLKYGQGVKVYAYELDDEGKPQINPQLALYALGAMYEYEHLGDFKTVTAVIVQPRLDHVSTCEVDVTDLKTFALKMKAAAFIALRHYESKHDIPMDAYKPSEKACQWCAAKHKCPALTALVETETRDLFGALMHNEEGIVPVTGETAQTIAAEIAPDRLAQAMVQVPLMEDFLKAIRAEVERRLLAGHPVPGFKLIEGRRGPRGWIDDERAEKDLRRILGAKDALVIKPISPTAAEKFKKQGLLSDRVWTNLNKNVERSDGKPSVAPESDPAPALMVSSSETLFAQLAASVEDLTTSTADDLV